MRGMASYRLAGIAMVLAIGFVGSLGLGVMLGLAVGARPVTERGAITQFVDRTHKGDRLSLPTDVGREQGPPAAVMVGCEPAYSSLLKPTATSSGRCIA
jgi:hypothetical protein